MNIEQVKKVGQELVDTGWPLFCKYEYEFAKEARELLASCGSDDFYVVEEFADGDIWRVVFEDHEKQWVADFDFEINVFDLRQE